MWTLAVVKFPDDLRRRVPRQIALSEIARCFLASAGMTVPGELARVTGLSRVDGGLGNRAFVAEGLATMLAHGWAGRPRHFVRAPVDWMNRAGGSRARTAGRS